MDPVGVMVTQQGIDQQSEGSASMDPGHAQRRLAVILAADVVSTSRTMDADEAVTLAALKTHRPDLNDEYQDRIVKLTSDGLLAEFLRFSGSIPKTCRTEKIVNIPLENAHSADIGPEV
jgi:class 3 adenylate cyclase